MLWFDDLAPASTAAAPTFQGFGVVVFTDQPAKRAEPVQLLGALTDVDDSERGQW